MEEALTSKLRQCQFTVKKKNRLCRQKAIKGSDYCGEHLLASGEIATAFGRIVCPLDSSHTCFEHLLESHLRKCNARQKPWPDFLIKNINGEDILPSSEKRSVHNVSDKELSIFITRVERIYHEHIPPAQQHNDGCHPIVHEKLKLFRDSPSLEKHLLQQGHLLQIMSQIGLLTADQMFVEFGAGRGQLSSWVMQALGDHEVRRSHFVLIDRASQRYKADNHFMDKWGASILRIKADIRHLSLDRLEPFACHEGRITSICKHLCGAAVDLALTCATKTIGRQKLPQGIVMAVCCHHRCEWRWYCGRSWFESQFGLTESEFQLMLSMAGWATCGYGFRKHRATHEIYSEPVEHSAYRDTSTSGYLPTGCEEAGFETPMHTKILDRECTHKSRESLSHDAIRPRDRRYDVLNLSPERRMKVGYMVKAILDEGRLHFLRSLGMNAKRVRFIDSTYTPENYAIVASVK